MVKYLPIVPIFALITACSPEHPDATVTAAISAGETLYKKNCKVCHAQGINGAPILGNQKMWRDRSQQPLTTLLEHASNGYGLMPAKGGSNLSDDDIEQVIRFMLDALDTH